VSSINDLKWWQTAVFYQIYPRSFADGNGDGIGDFHGMIDKLEYLRLLSVDALWLSPFYPSPLFDCGYDIADYTGVAREYGTLDDFQRLLEEAHGRGMRVILDLVLNHTSDRHPWFVESKSRRGGPKRDWYIWREGRNGLPPNNWQSRFGGPAWEFDAATHEYYYHYFFKEQPDLNWRNPEVKRALWNAVRFWLDRGVDGFRLDAISTIFEDPALTDHTAGMSLLEVYRGFGFDAFGAASTDEEQQRQTQRALTAFQELFRQQRNLPEVHRLMQELRALVDKYDERVLVGESAEISYYGDGANELHLVFNFPLMRTDHLTPAWVRDNQEARLSALPKVAWPCNTLNNHDTSRVFSRYGDGSNDAAIARLSLALMLTLRGTPFLYNGEEIGMTDLILDDVRQFKDNLGVWVYHMLVDGLGISPAEAQRRAARIGRDKCRTPMQWANAPNGGFSPAGVQPWLPVSPNCAQGVNVADQREDPNSLLSFYKRMLQVRKQNPVLFAGDYGPLNEGQDDYFAFVRRSPADGQTCLVILNMSARAHTAAFELESDNARVVFSSRDRDREMQELSQVTIAPFEVFIAELT
jgi:alpha-glucosidase